MVSDADYPPRVAHTLLTKVLDDVSSKVEWKMANAESLKNYKEIDIVLARYQDPKQADALTKIQAELDETKIIMVLNYS